MSISVSQKFKVGDRVEVKGRTVSSLRFWEHNFRQRGTITEIETDYANRPKVVVQFDNGDADSGHPDNLILIEPAPDPQPTSPTITLKPGDYAATVAEDGTLTLTPVQEKAEEVKREPQMGEVWRDTTDGDYVLITGAHDEDGDPQVVTLGGGGYPVGSCAHAYQGDLVYAYPTLRAAAEAGAL